MAIVTLLMYWGGTINTDPIDGRRCSCFSLLHWKFKITMWESFRKFSLGAEHYQQRMFSFSSREVHGSQSRTRKNRTRQHASMHPPDCVDEPINRSCFVRSFGLQQIKSFVWDSLNFLFNKGGQSLQIVSIFLRSASKICKLSSWFLFNVERTDGRWPKTRQRREREKNFHHHE